MICNQISSLFDKENLSLIPEKSQQELTELFGKDFAMLKGYSQNNPHHCYDLLIHSVKTAQALDSTNLTLVETIELTAAALYHDIGKPFVAFNKNGRTVFYNHPKKSKEIAQKELKRIGFDNDSLNRILFYIEFHDTFISFKKPDEKEYISNPHIIPIQKTTVLSKVASIQKSCKNNGNYIPSHKDFVLLLKLSLADADAQSEKVIQNGVLVDSKKAKIRRLISILKIIEENVM